jgi:predicted RNase H-like HicB family nuclease
LADDIALIQKDADSDYSVSFPDFPGCITAGATIDEARALAAEALAFHVEGMREDGQEIPAPSPIAAAMRERENRDAVAFLVTLPEQADRHVRIQITMAERLVREIDARTDNRSKFLADAAQRALRKSAKLPPKLPARLPRKTAAKAPARWAATKATLSKRSRKPGRPRKVKRTGSGN